MLNAILKLEGKVQELDQTRFDASKSFATKGADPITTATIMPGADGVAIDIFDVDQANWFLDWVWPDFKIDIDNTRNKIIFKRIADGLIYTAILTDGTYTPAQLQTEILAQLTAISAVTWVVELTLKNEFTLTSNENVELQCGSLDANFLPFIGLTETKTDKTFKGPIIEWLPRNIILTLGDGTTTESKTFVQKIYSVEGDALFSTDQDLLAHEPSILDWVSTGRNSFIDAHRRSQEKIMQWIDQNGYLSNVGKRITKWQILDLEDVRLWSTYMTLHHLFVTFQNSKDDVLKEKSKYYLDYMVAARNQAVLVIDFNNNGKAEPEERTSTVSGQLRMR